MRARRRYDELVARGAAVDLGTTLQELLERDRRDETRQAAPLRAADDALRLDTSDLSLAQVVDRIEAVARERLQL